MSSVVNTTTAPSAPVQIYKYNDKEGIAALEARDVAKLKELYAACGNKLTNLLKENEIFFFLKRAENSDLEVVAWLLDAALQWQVPLDYSQIAQAWITKLPLLKCMLEKCHYRINDSNFGAAFERAASLLPEAGIPAMQMILERMEIPTKNVTFALIGVGCNGDAGMPVVEWLHAKVSDKLNLAECFVDAAANKGVKLPFFKWLLEQAGEKITKKDIQCAFKSALWAGSEDLVKWILQVAEDKIDDAFFNDCLCIYLKKGKEGLSTIAALVKSETFHKRFARHGASDADLLALQSAGNAHCVPYLLNSRFPFSENTFKACFSYATQLGTNGIPLLKLVLEKMQKEGNVTLSPEDIETIIKNFLDAWGSETSQLVPFFERACKQFSEKLSAFSIRRAFLKAALKGDGGLPLIECLCLNAAGKLSYWTLKQAHLMAQKAGHANIVKWLEMQESLVKDESDKKVDDDDIKLQLAISQDPFGYRALGDIPERHQWLPLMHDELEKMIPKGTNLSAEEEAFDSTIKVVNDNEKPAFDEIRKSEAALFTKLYALIKSGQGPMKIEGEEIFRNAILSDLRKILSRPSGRWLILMLCRSIKNRSIYIREGKEYEFEYRWFFVTASRSKFMVYARDDHGKKSDYICPSDSALFHELVHAYHYSNGFPSFLSAIMPSSDVEYGNLEEQCAIAGVDEGSLLEDHFILCENCYNYERGYPRRYGHKAKLVKDEPIISLEVKSNTKN